jgi:hypothetical protein
MADFADLARALLQAEVRFVLIGVGGINFYARSPATVFTTIDRDLFLPLDAENELRAWQALEGCGLSLWLGQEPLDQPRDRWLAEQVVARQALVRASDGGPLQVDLTLVMAGHEFEDVWQARRRFRLGDVEVPVARLTQLVRSKAAAGRPKDRLFLATHAAALRELGDLDQR